MTSSNRLIDSVRALLRDEVLPELQSDLARARLRQVLATLRQVDFDDAPLALLRENAALEELLRALGDPAPAPSAVAAAPRFDDVARRHAALRNAVAVHFAAIPGWTPGHAAAAAVLADCAAGRGRRDGVRPASQD